LFKRRVVIHWPSDWSASNTKILKLDLKSSSSARDTTKVKITCGNEELNTTLLWEEVSRQIVSVVLSVHKKGCTRYLFLPDTGIRRIQKPDTGYPVRLDTGYPAGYLA
jgi:hypothetical protein